MNRDIIALYDEYTHAPLSRRAFIDRLIKLTGSAAAAYALLPILENNYSQAAIVPVDDPALTTQKISFPAGSDTISGYLAQPKAAGTYPGVIVIHENRGLNPHIEDVARHMAKEGFIALAPDLLSPLGGTPKDEDQARELIGKLDAAQTVTNLQAAVAWLRENNKSSDKVGAMGFCWGGGMVNQLAVAEPTLNAGVAYYGRQPEATQVPQIKAPLLLHYAGLDDRINAGIPAYRTALAQGGKTFELYMYDGADHAFNNDTNAARYNKAAAELAWDRTVAFFKKYLG